ncbi:Senescence-associated protein [Melia azedarach]|uniref:Senescence-associated protein n=1 Tax=Melia azedarach TaxID=155640 RepID=A0ACC1XF19_MELAZ|nr:Senescence-associated protein [Melia azedarach]
MLLYKQKKNQTPKGNRLLISITVLGSAGPIRFVVNEQELVAAVIDTALKSYAREGRLPVLGSDLNDFLLYCSNAGSALSPWDTIGSHGVRNFMLCKKPQAEKTTEDGRLNAAIVARRGGSGSWKAWINKSLNFKIPTH